MDNKPSLQGYGDMKVHKAEGRYFSRPEWGAPFVSFTKPKLQKPQLTKLPPDVRKYIRSFLPDHIEEDEHNDEVHLGYERAYGKMRGMPNYSSYEDYIDWRDAPFIPDWENFDFE